MIFILIKKLMINSKGFVLYNICFEMNVTTDFQMTHITHVILTCPYVTCYLLTSESVRASRERGAQKVCARLERGAHKKCARVTREARTKSVRARLKRGAHTYPIRAHTLHTHAHRPHTLHNKKTSDMCYNFCIYLLRCELLTS